MSQIRVRVGLGAAIFVAISIAVTAGAAAVWSMPEDPANRARRAIAAVAHSTIDRASVVSPDAEAEALAPTISRQDALREHDPEKRPARQWEFIQQAGTRDCVTDLAATQAKFTPLPEQDVTNAHGCGIPRGVLMTQGPTGIRYSPPLRVDCSFALRLIEIETILLEEATRHIHAQVHTIGTRGSYNCREVVGRLKGWSGGISEHSFGNAIDVAHFDTASGKRVSVERHYPLLDSAEGRFLRAVVKRTWGQADMRALGPEFDSAHRDHLHIDAGSRWWRWK